MDDEARERKRIAGRAHEMATRAVARWVRMHHPHEWDAALADAYKSLDGKHQPPGRPPNH